MINDISRETEGKMKKSVEALRQHLTTIRTGRASPALVEHMQVEAYGSPMPMNQLAGISTPEERRRDLTKQVRARVEESRVALRNLRREALDDVKQMEHEKLISENDQRRAQDQLQTLTDKYIREADQVGAAKEAEVMEV